MTRLIRSRLPAATVIMPGIFPRHWDGGDFKGRQFAMDAWPNPLAQVPSCTHCGVGLDCSMRSQQPHLSISHAHMETRSKGSCVM